MNFEKMFYILEKSFLLWQLYILDVIYCFGKHNKLFPTKRKKKRKKEKKKSPSLRSTHVM
jgi:hypothetical protein